MNYEFVTGDDPRFLALCRELDQFLGNAIGHEKQRTLYDHFNAAPGIRLAVLALDGETPVGCGGIKEYAPGTAELKRMFVRAEVRGRGIGGTIEQALEARAREEGYARLILETGKSLSGARRRYASLGFLEIENYGQYAGMPNSVCMEKAL